jgi:hypothetical protein
MHWIFFLVSFFAGLIVFSFTVIVIFTIFVFGIPTTRKLEKLTMLKPNNKIVSGYMVSLIVLSVFFVGISWVVFRYFPNQFIGYLIGCGFSFVFGISKTGANKDNISDYVQTNERTFLVHPGQVIEAILTNK